MSSDHSAADQLIRRWQDEAARLDTDAARARAADQGARLQIHAWETRAQALRDCATDLWQLATDEDGACPACGTPLQLCGHR